MPHASLTVVVTAVMVVAAGCGDAQSNSLHQAVAKQSPRAPGLIVEGSSATLPMDGGGSLHVRVTVRRDLAGHQSVVLSAERERCDLEPTSGGDSVVACHRLWRQTRKLTRADYALDALVRMARVRAQVRGRLLSLSWRAASARREQVGGPEDGYVLLQSADAVSGGHWGGVRWRLPARYDPDRDAGTTLYRRIVTWAAGS